MIINITPKANRFISEQGNALLIKIEQKLACCCGGSKTSSYPSVQLGKPESHEISEYKQREVEGVNIFCHSTAEKLADTMNIDVDIEGENISSRMVMRRLPEKNPNN
ncbi:hypothetical protein SDC9_27471 [bioreactor metagenome]|uniref:FeS cluster biogenesis domain-containing protein n=1 Tax=bioreactor metagenome TaxID=1076179 RepID=A0A644US68_9ZZZZ|nr:CC/Se motif family (seleno)protein [Negativicutes bacterium]